mmetsp:Transcript_62136/g.183662  ORF Transcript_62136/g.183662 Transcript_62136/m.183662 type:complete len:251 (-) Transcript_62136:769-1521(-)
MQLSLRHHNSCGGIALLFSRITRDGSCGNSHKNVRAVHVFVGTERLGDFNNAFPIDIFRQLGMLILEIRPIHDGAVAIDEAPSARSPAPVGEPHSAPNRKDLEFHSGTVVLAVRRVPLLHGYSGSDIIERPRFRATHFLAQIFYELFGHFAAVIPILITFQDVPAFGDKGCMLLATKLNEPNARGTGLMRGLGNKRSFFGYEFYDGILLVFTIFAVRELKLVLQNQRTRNGNSANLGQPSALRDLVNVKR